MLVGTGFARMDETKDTALDVRALTSETTEDKPVGAMLTDAPANTPAETRGCVAEDERLEETDADDALLAEVAADERLVLTEVATDDALLAEVAAADDARLLEAVFDDPPEPPSPMDRRAELCAMPIPRPPKRVAPELPPMRARFSRCSCSWFSTGESYGPGGAAMVVAAKAVNDVAVKNRIANTDVLTKRQSRQNEVVSHFCSWNNRRGICPKIYAFCL